MAKKIVIGKIDPKLLEGLNVATSYIASKGIDVKLIELIKMRTSQINGCAYCLEIHWKIAVEAGETYRRIIALSTWKESPLFSDAERAILQMCEEIALISEGNLRDETVEELSKYFSEDEIASLVMTAIIMNAWNRVGLIAKHQHK